MYIEI